MYGHLHNNKEKNIYTIDQITYKVIIRKKKCNLMYREVLYYKGCDIDSLLMQTLVSRAGFKPA